MIMDTLDPSRGDASLSPNFEQAFAFFDQRAEAPTLRRRKVAGEAVDALGQSHCPKGDGAALVRSLDRATMPNDMDGHVAPNVMDHASLLPTLSHRKGLHDCSSHQVSEEFSNLAGHDSLC